LRCECNSVALNLTGNMYKMVEIRINKIPKGKNNKLEIFIKKSLPHRLDKLFFDNVDDLGKKFI